MGRNFTAITCAAFIALTAPARSDDLDDANAICMRRVASSAGSIRPLQSLQRAAEPGSNLPITADGIAFQPGFEDCRIVIVRHVQRARDRAAQQDAADLRAIKGAMK